jgi:hypothetical protein
MMTSPDVVSPFEDETPGGMTCNNNPLHPMLLIPDSDMLFPFLKLTKFPPPYGGVLTFYYTSHDMNRFIPHVHCARPLNGFENGLLRPLPFNVSGNLEFRAVKFYFRIPASI